MSEPFSPEQRDPAALSTALTEFVTRHEPGTPMHVLATDLLRSHGVNRDRRAAVLKHKDLAARLVAELGYQRPEQWNGYIPPAVTDPGGQERLCQGASPGRHGDFLARLNQIGHYGLGEMPNDSPRREALLGISREAWARERRATVEAAGPPEGTP